ncbi:hypothetical protein ABIF25_004881 [Bradyrhizobium elkanii]
MACQTQQLQHALQTPRRAEPRSRSTLRWSAPASPDFTCCIGCARRASRRLRSKRAPTSAAPGTGIAIPAPAATSRPSTTATPSIPSSIRPGPGRRNTPPSRKSCAISASSPTATICVATSGSAPKSRRRPGTMRPDAGRSRPTTAPTSRAATTSWRPAACRRRSRRRSTASRTSRARSISPAAGRIRASISRASALR